jgi:DNA-binding NarL/FixJ family response regulator
MFDRMGAEAFAERPRGELLAAGENVRKRPAGVRDELTPQERQIARRAQDGQSNSQIAAELFLSPRTVEWHLRKVFNKLGIGDLKRADGVVIGRHLLLLASAGGAVDARTRPARRLDWIHSGNRRHP